MPSLSWNETRSRASHFVREYKDAAHEERQKHQFWIDFFQCFGVPLKSVAVFEKAVENLKGNYGFLDLFWPGVLLVEHKSRGASLDKASSQAFAYLSDLARQGKHDQLPRFVILCDFARFVLFDLEPDDQKALPLFDTGKAYRTVEFPLAELHKHIKEFAFIRGEKTVRLDPESPANMEATQLLAELHDALHDSGLQGHTLERLLVRILFCLFAEDTGIFDLVTFTRLVQRTREDGSDLGLWLAQLFQVLNTPEPDRQRNLDDDLAAFPYVNGGLFAEALPIATFTSAQRAALLKCCLFYWARISPAVFGSLFQGILDGKERRQLGAHYTTERDILKLLRAIFLDDLRTELDSAHSFSRKANRIRHSQSIRWRRNRSCGMTVRHEPTPAEKHPLAEVFGFPTSDLSADAKRHRKKRLCPFNNKIPNCTKDKANDPLGVCSVVHQGETVITCPIRFRQGWRIADDAAEFFFPQDATWTSLTEVRLKDGEGGSAGNIDVVLCAYDESGKVYDFGSLEVQAVYISGNVRNPFAHYMESPDKRGDMDWTQEENYPRPDYLSSSRKRLAPQLIFKGGILHSWGKKSAVALNQGFFDTLPSLPEVTKAEAEIAWFIYDIDPSPAEGTPHNLVLKRVAYTKFETALLQITKPRPGPIQDFLRVLQNKLDEKLETPPNNKLIDKLF